MHQQGPTWRHDGVAALLIVCVAAMLLWRADQIGPTVDEPFHLIRGLAWWWTDSTKLSYAHPPLANLLQALPAALGHAPVELTTLPGWTTSDHAAMAEELFARDYETIRSEFNTMWTELVQYHRDRGIQLQPRVSHNFRIIDTIVRNL